MSTIQIRNVPEDLHRRLKVRAAERGESLSSYLLAEILANADKPTLAEWAAHVGRMPTRASLPPVADILNAERRG